MLLPAAFLVYAALLIARKLQSAATKLIATGAILLAVASLHSTFNYFGAYLLDIQTFARIVVYTSFIFESLNIVALLLIGIGLIKLAKNLPEEMNKRGGGI